jgi:hypothetical protein
MTWQAYRLVYQLKSPLHVGWRKIGNLMQTRPYIPGRNWWGAATALLTQHVGTCDYESVGNLVRDNLIFSYFFLATDQDKPLPLVPGWDTSKGKTYYGPLPENQSQEVVGETDTSKGKTYYGPLPPDQFERRFLKSQAATAIDTQSNTSLEGQLYEVEYIAPYDQEASNGAATPVCVVGYLFARAGEQVVCQSNDVVVKGKPLFNQVLRRVQIGGERRYGFGTLELVKAIEPPENKLFGYEWKPEGNYPVLTIGAGMRVPAHLRAEGCPSLEGKLEPLVGREWCQKKGPGQQISTVQICWSPGTPLKHESAVEVQPLGVMHDVS